MAGAALERIVGGELTKQIAWNETLPGLFHYETHAQQEVDFVLEDARGRLVGQMISAGPRSFGSANVTVPPASEVETMVLPSATSVWNFPRII